MYVPVMFTSQLLFIVYLIRMIVYKKPLGQRVISCVNNIALTMSRRILKCTVCGCNHSIFHCESKCGVCHGDNRERSCLEQPPLNKKKKKSGKQKQSSGDQQSVKDLRKLYFNLQKEHKSIRREFQNLKEQNEELAHDLAEREAEIRRMVLRVMLFLP